jgi:hypothetical protein
LITQIGTWKSALIVGTFGGVALCLAGCGGAKPTTPPPNQAVVITVQPLSQTVPIGQTATFAVTATGTAPLSYQWSENGSAILGATGASYTTPTVELGASDTTLIGTFQVTISNSVNSVTSNAVTLTAGPRSPKAGDLRYLLFQQVDEPGLFNASAGGSGVVSVEGSGDYAKESVPNGLGSPLSVGSSACGVSDGNGVCGWAFEYQFLPSPMAGLSMCYQPGSYSTYQEDLQSYAAPNIVFTSLDLEPVEGFYAVSWVQTTQPGGFDSREDTLIPPGANQQAQIQAQATLDGSESRIVTAVSFDASGNAVLISYGWTGDTTTAYEAQTTLVPASEVLSTATNLAGQGYFISAFGGNDTDGYILVGMRVKGDGLPRPIVSSTPIPTTMPYYSPVLYLYEDDVMAVYEQ